MPVKFLLSYTLEAFYPLRPYKDCSLEQLLRVLATSDKGIQKKINYFFAYPSRRSWIIHFMPKNLLESL